MSDRELNGINTTDTDYHPKVYIETYGCQMNLNDTEIVLSVMKNEGYTVAAAPEEADIILLNTCSVRENAERKIHERLKHLKSYKKKNKALLVGILGCMAERLRLKLLEDKDIVDLVVGPDEYRKVPELIEKAQEGEKGLAVKLSRVETYDDIEPLRTDNLSAWVSIMRGCNNFCSYCVVPYTRGRERSRKFSSIIDEVLKLRDGGFKEITLLGQNVNSYLDADTGRDFADLLAAAALAAKDVRIRYTTSHPRDMSDKLIETMAAHDNICKHIHLPVQSGSNRILELMNRKYTVEHYLERISKIRELLPGCAISTDIIAGFPTETLEDHEATMNAIKIAGYDGAFMFKYSPRENTKAYNMTDDVPEEEKLRRLNEIIGLQQQISKERNKLEIHKVHDILVEGKSKRNPNEMKGRTDTNKTVIFPVNDGMIINPGDVVKVMINKVTAATMRGELI